MKNNHQIPSDTRNSFRFRSFNYDSMSAMITRNSGLAMVGLIIRLCPAMGGKPSAFVASSTKLTLVKLASIAKHQGLPGLVKYLKIVSVQTQQYLGGHHSVMHPRISRTNSGIPRLFPPLVRKMIKASNIFFIRWSLTIASLYRDVMFEGPLKLSTIIKPFDGKEGIFNELGKYIPIFIKAILNQSRLNHLSMRDWVQGRYKAFPITTSSPQKGSDAISSTSPLVVIRSALAFPESLLDSFSIILRMFAFDKGNHPLRLIREIRGYKDSHLDRNHHPIGSNVKPIGKLGLKVEAAGKMRIFAMVDPWTQWILAPFHKGIFHILERIPQDGTFNQLKPLAKAWVDAEKKNAKKPLYSMDLSSATDRLPLRLQKPLLACLFDMTLLESEAWGNILVGRPYFLSARMKKLVNNETSSVTYSVGQPMGALSSWAMLALTHHFIVQCSAWISGQTPSGVWFKEYAVLGDDIVIFNTVVAKCYHRLITDLGVECNINKSIMSPSGDALEFAKQTFYKGTCVSPITFKGFYSALESVPSLVEWGKTYHLTLSQLLKSAGFGYRVLGGLNKPINKQNIKTQYVIFGLLSMNPRSLQESFFNITYFRNKSAVFKAYFKFVSMWCKKLQDQMRRETELLYNIEAPGKGTGLFYLFYKPLWSLVYEPSVQRMITIRESFVELIGQKVMELDDFLKYDVSYFERKNLPIECEPIIFDEVSALLWESMKAYSNVISLPVSSLSYSAQKSSAFSFGRGVPSLFNKHKAFINLLHGKDQPMKEASFLPLMRLVSPLIRRVSVGRLLTFTANKTVKRLIFSTSFLVSSASMLSLSMLVFGPIKVLTYLGIIISSLNSVSSTGLGIPGMEYIIDVIERLVLLITFISGIVIILKWSTLSAGMIILKEQLIDGMPILDYLVEVFKLLSHTTLLLIAEYSDTVVQPLLQSGLFGNISFSIILTMITMYILRWIFSL